MATIKKTEINHFDDAKALIKYSRQSLKSILNNYYDCLMKKAIEKKLLIATKNFMENLRSALDFTARGLFIRYGDNNKNQKHIFFPYAWKSLDKNGFDTQNIINKNIPGLKINRPDIALKIESYQHFSDVKNSWLPKFMELNNLNKHQSLTPQVKHENKGLHISSPGSNISFLLEEGASLVLGLNASISMGKTFIPGNQTININNPVRIVGESRQEIVFWISFHFTYNNEPVIPLLESSLNGISEIIEELSIM